VSQEFELHQRVRVVSDGLPVPAGSEGVVIGFYRRERVMCAVSFDGDVQTIAVDDLAAVEE
jgi:hypothetical protein